ncbi:malonate decarboxylase holo-ACP synthase [Xenorhabdus sp. IM139775]|uniref:malonate decarboxylase holo-ACP synthase n=1 Tax=Xenorhabdus sp. IM139775 TaxID=3025876 RepID=UPI0023597245|nr:malonate decarboxylase holo-ACP synthase [Xenorhabdus sp. IM139775]MDC9592752.1 malonate decarboxylase holo-ACP synthase [Xenorhabdus sp. IM139775]
MQGTVNPHDLLWIERGTELKSAAAIPDWVWREWDYTLPVVVRRDRRSDNDIPVGIRGEKRSHRFPLWIKYSAINRVETPEGLFLKSSVFKSSVFKSSVFKSNEKAQLSHIPAIQAFVMLKNQQLKWPLGVIGGCGYTLATGISAININSDLDLLLRTAHQIKREELLGIESVLKTLPCRVDMQIEGPVGAFALNDYLRNQAVLLKTNNGPLISSYPWG